MEVGGCQITFLKEDYLEPKSGIIAGLMEFQWRRFIYIKSMTYGFEMTK